MKAVLSPPAADDENDVPVDPYAPGEQQTLPISEPGDPVPAGPTRSGDTAGRSARPPEAQPRPVSPYAEGL